MRAQPPSATNEQIEAYQRDGVTVLRGVFTDWIETLREGVAALMAQPSPLERTVRPADGTAPFFQDLCNWQRIAPFKAFVLESGAARLAAQLMRSNSARFFHDHVLVKQPGGSTVTPWHQDQPYYCVQGTQSVSFWTPLDPVAREVAMECVRGSHRWGRQFTPMRFNGTRLNEVDRFDAMPDIDADRSAFDIAGWALQPGDAIAFHFSTVHGAPGNRSAQMRRVFSSRWVGDDATYVQRGGMTSPPLRDLGLADGAPFEGAAFPVVFKAPR
jgi:ectoine hydroxylase-related dioxygenase (phytanoyl-CoA dioxygenase family)